MGNNSKDGSKKKRMVQSSISHFFSAKRSPAATARRPALAASAGSTQHAIDSGIAGSPPASASPVKRKRVYDKRISDSLSQFAHDSAASASASTSASASASASASFQQAKRIKLDVGRPNDDNDDDNDDYEIPASSGASKALAGLSSFSRTPRTTRRISMEASSNLSTTTAQSRTGHASFTEDGAHDAAPTEQTTPSKTKPSSKSASSPLVGQVQMASGRLVSKAVLKQLGLSLRHDVQTKLTPLEEQVVQIKQDHPDVLLLVEVGYKYQFFGSDAEKASRVLHIMAGWGTHFKASSIPVHRLHVHVRRLVEAGFKVGVVTQTETAAVKKAGSNKSKPFSRELTSLYTKGTLVGSDFTEDEIDSLGNDGTFGDLLCLYEATTPLKDTVSSSPESSSQVEGTTRTSLGLVSINCTTGRILYDMFDDSESRSELASRLEHLKPCEIIHADTLSSSTRACFRRYRLANHGVRMEAIASETFCEGKASIELAKFLHSDEMDKTASAAMAEPADEPSDVHKLLDAPAEVQCACCALIRHLRQFKLDMLVKNTSNFERFDLKGCFMQLPGTTVRNLELFQASHSNNKQGSVLWTIDRTRSKFGARMLRSWLSRPLMDPRTITARLDAVDMLRSPSMTDVIERVRKLLASLPDLEKSLCAIYSLRCTCAQLYRILEAMTNLASELEKAMAGVEREKLPPLLQGCLMGVPPLLSGCHNLLEQLDADACADNNKTGAFRDDTLYPSLAQYRKQLQDIEDELREHRKELRKQLKDPSFDYVTVSGLDYLVQVKNSKVATLPQDWVKMNGTKQVARFRDPFTVNKIDARELLREQQAAEAERCFADFLRHVNDHYDELHRATQLLAELDCLLSFAEIAEQPGFCRPTILEGDQAVIDIVAGRHIVVESILASQYVPNDTHLRTKAELCMLITGPNMGGKSSYIRQVATICILAQIGCFVPADQVDLTPLDGVYSRMGAEDDIFSGASTFMVELQEASEILAKATSRSLIIMDELGRGTSTFDGVAIAHATLEHILKEIRCPCLFVTHYPSLAELRSHYPQALGCYHMGFIEQDDDRSGQPTILFLYQLIPRLASKSYGLNVARLAGLPQQVLDRAAVMSQEFEDRKFAPSTSIEKGSASAAAVVALLNLQPHQPAQRFEDAAKNVVVTAKDSS